MCPVNKRTRGGNDTLVYVLFVHQGWKRYLCIGFVFPFSNIIRMETTLCIGLMYPVNKRFGNDTLVEALCAHLVTHSELKYPCISFMCLVNK